MKTLDCGHIEDEGKPAQVQNSAGKIETVQGWTFVFTEDGRKICHACADKIVLSCGHNPSPHEVFTTGYATKQDGSKICYQCAAKEEEKAMIASGKTVLYLTTLAHGDAKIGDWTGTLSFNGRYHRGAHNMARYRYDVWFNGPDGHIWHGVTIGDNTQLCHCKRTKELVHKVVA